MKTQVILPSKKMWIACILGGLFIASVLTNTASAQLYNLSPEDLKAFTATNPYGRYPNGRPMIPDAVLDSVKRLNIQVIEAHGIVARAMAGPRGGGGGKYYEDGWKTLDPNKKIYGRAVTVQFMPNRPELVAGMRYLSEKN
jgi:hypothetical protein